MKKIKIPLPGFRTIKTAISIFICFLLYFIVNRQNVLLAAFAAMICMQDSVKRTLHDGISRIIGTLIGGIFGFLYLVLTGGLKDYAVVWYLLVSIGIVMVIYGFNLLRQNDSIIIGCVLFLTVTVDPAVGNPFFYTLTCVIDTIIGICVAVLVNKLPLGKANDRSMLTKGGDVKLRHEILKEKNYSKTKWVGGQMSEIYIYPENQLFADKRFGWRASVSTTNIDETTFSLFEGYSRHLMLLDGTLTLVHEDKDPVIISKYEQDYFDTGSSTDGYGACEDFNLFLSNKCDGKLLACENNIPCFLKYATQKQKINNFCLIYALVQSVKIAVFYDEKLLMQLELEKGDAVCFKRLDEFDRPLKFIPYSRESVKSEIVCVTAYILCE